MRHRKDTFKLGRESSHNRCMIATMLKSLIDKEKIYTTLAKAKELRRHADHMITLAKNDTLNARRLARAELMIRYNTLTIKQKKQVKEGNISSYNTDRRVIQKLFSTLKDRFKERAGGYTRIVKVTKRRVGDNAPLCYLEYLSE